MANEHHVVQVELSRRLYMDELSLIKTASFERMRAFCGGLVERMTQVRP